MQVTGSRNLSSKVKNTIDKGTEGTFNKHGDGIYFCKLTASDKAFVRDLLRQTQFILQTVDQSWWCGVQVKAGSDGKGRWKDRSGIVGR